MTEQNMYPRDSVVPERMSLGAQLRIAGAVLAVMGAALLTKDISPEQQDPEWVRLRQIELDAQAAYDNLPVDDPGKSGAHSHAQAKWRDRDTYEAENFDPQS
jgi:hypothetical protein